MNTNNWTAPSRGTARPLTVNPTGDPERHSSVIKSTASPALMRADVDPISPHLPPMLGTLIRPGGHEAPYPYPHALPSSGHRESGPGWVELPEEITARLAYERFGSKPANQTESKSRQKDLQRPDDGGASPPYTDGRTKPVERPDELNTAPQTWVDRLSTLVARRPEQGLAADIASMSLCELWGTYRHLTRVVEGA